MFAGRCQRNVQYPLQLHRYTAVLYNASMLIAKRKWGQITSKTTSSSSCIFLANTIQNCVENTSTHTLTSTTIGCLHRRKCTGMTNYPIGPHRTTSGNIGPNNRRTGNSGVNHSSLLTVPMPSAISAVPQLALIFEVSRQQTSSPVGFCPSPELLKSTVFEGLSWLSGLLHCNRAIRVIMEFQ